MRFCIQHSTCYKYERPVLLGPQTIRLRPRHDVNQTLGAFRLSVEPKPDFQSAILDLEGNNLLRLWFDDVPVSTLAIHSYAVVETHLTNPFDYLAEPWAVTLPLDYPCSLANSLQPYCRPILPASMDAEVVALAQSILQEVSGNVSMFLTTFTQRIYGQCQYQVRELGPPLPAGVTWRQKKGSCRDFAALLMAGCQSVGLAARFVSGYEAGDINQDQRDLHAWTEVYIPGGGWRGFDPTHGLAVADRHIALAAAPFPQMVAPVSGELRTKGISASLETNIHLEIEASQ